VLLNAAAAAICDRIKQDAARLRIGVSTAACGTQLLDFGIEAAGGLEAGLAMVEVCLAGLGRASLVPAHSELDTGLAVQVTSDHPIAACMASQYAGWKVSGGKFFAMGSGPMRAAAGKEALFERIGFTEKSTTAVGVLETRQVPPDDVCLELARSCGVEPGQLTLLLAPTASQAGNVQIVGRSLETALHKLLELGFDPARVVSGWGLAPLPPVAANDLVGIGRTNDAILYGGEVTIYVRGDDASLEAIGPRVPSGSSSDFGQPFATIFERYHRDFYRIDPHLFSPAMITLVNLDTGRAMRFGHLVPRVIHESFDIRHLGS
jgi:methenyltetrahydromethanopterin cyclohydrolase